MLFIVVALCSVLGTYATGFVLSVVDSDVSSTHYLHDSTQIFCRILSAMIVTLSDHPEASLWPCLLLFCSNLLFYLASRQSMLCLLRRPLMLIEGDVTC